jgi:hypothetical protein
LLLLSIVVPRININTATPWGWEEEGHQAGLQKDDGQGEKWTHAEAGRVGRGGRQWRWIRIP